MHERLWPVWWMAGRLLSSFGTFFSLMTLSEIKLLITFFFLMQQLQAGFRSTACDSSETWDCSVSYIHMSVASLAHWVSIYLSIWNNSSTVFGIKNSAVCCCSFKRLLFKTLSLLNGNCLRHPIPGKWMCALVPILVFARHHGLLFGLPFLRVVGFFNEHFDPTQVWRWCLREPEEKTKKKKKEEEGKKKCIPFFAREVWAVVSSVAATSGPWGPSSPSSDRQPTTGRSWLSALSSHARLDFEWKVQKQMTKAL